MRKNKLLLFFAILTSLSTNFNREIYVKADETNPYVNNYLRIGENETTIRWKHVNNMEEEYTGAVQEFVTANGTTKENLTREPIVFFNANPAWNIKQIDAIYMRVVDSNGKEVSFYEYNQEYELVEQHPYSYYRKVEPDKNDLELRTLTKISYDDYTISTYLEGTKQLNKSTYSISRFKYQNGTFVKGVYKWETKYPDMIQYVLPRLGTTNIIRTFYQHMGQQKYGQSMINSSFFPYLTTPIDDGYLTAEEAMNSSAVTNPEYYLILPLAMTSGFKIDYLGIEATDINGNKISPVIDFINEADKISFNIEYLNGEWVTPNAVYFPGRNAYTATSFRLENYQIVADSTEETTVITALGNLINRDSIEENNLKQTNLLYPDKTIEVLYQFNGDNNCLIVEIAKNVLSAKVVISFVKSSGYTEAIQAPFYINLIDENGNYGIRGGLPVEVDPNHKTTWQLFTDGIKSLFDFSKISFDSPINAVTSTFKLVFLTLISVLIVYSIIKLIQFIKIKTKRA